MLSNSVRGERDDVGIIMANVSNMECIQDCQAKCQRINVVSRLDRVLDTGINTRNKQRENRTW